MSRPCRRIIQEAHHGRGHNAVWDDAGAAKRNPRLIRCRETGHLQDSDGSSSFGVPVDWDSGLCNR